jgi:DNA-directed RNA polymerase specialized sigma24 family protein
MTSIEHAVFQYYQTPSLSALRRNWVLWSALIPYFQRRAARFIRTTFGVSGFGADYNADDLSAQLIQSFYRSLESRQFDHDGFADSPLRHLNQFSAWRCRDFYRQSSAILRPVRSFVGGEELSLESRMPSPESAFQDGLRRASMEGILQRLSPDSFQAYDALYVRNLKPRAWADESGQPVGEVYGRHQNLKRQISRDPRAARAWEQAC